jgi:hypothetical protein
MPANLVETQADETWRRLQLVIGIAAVWSSLVVHPIAFG